MEVIIILLKPRFQEIEKGNINTVVRLILNNAFLPTLQTKMPEKRTSGIQTHWQRKGPLPITLIPLIFLDRLN